MRTMRTRLGRVLKTRRAQRGLTQAVVAQRAGVTQTYIAKLESGDKKSPSLALLQRLAKALDLPVTAFLPVRPQEWWIPGTVEKAAEPWRLFSSREEAERYALAAGFNALWRLRRRADDIISGPVPIRGT